MRRVITKRGINLASKVRERGESSLHTPVKATCLRSLPDERRKDRAHKITYTRKVSEEREVTYSLGSPVSVVQSDCRLAWQTEAL